MTVTHPHLLEKAVRSETTRFDRLCISYFASLWGVNSRDFRFIDQLERIRADYKRRVQKKGRAA